MSVRFQVKSFEELSVQELYQVLQLRSEVFVVEQTCAYQDVDGKDVEALHLLGIFEGAIVAYARLFAPGYSFDNASLGRVVISANYRDRKWGHDLINSAISSIKELYGEDKITISAQLYLKKFYEGHGFVQDGDGYLEDDIPHIKMVRE
ncbi:LADA_0D11298g1_1 [Lachancea dasiensis]|uniref:LADA_0D11298g1_1 n=1 Tax=Lachancea dasiensis TaxID=1072105 RepID=A0A1G4J812_9SACH|nr:LADA_0D11298g1_1 [Lachancea dasiensis]